MQQLSWKERRVEKVVERKVVRTCAVAVVAVVAVGQLHMGLSRTGEGEGGG